MWESLPIQTSPGPLYTMIDREFVYPVSESVRISRWKDVPENIQVWATSIWNDVFHAQRNFMGDNDLLIWIPRVSTLVAKHGKWIGDDKSFYSVFVTCNYVDADFRGQGISSQMILSMANEATKIWGPAPFLFEVHNIPRGLVSIQPFLRFTYVWIPFIQIQNPPRWTPCDLSAITEKGYPGFYADHMEGYRAFSYDGQMILLDPLNDIVYYTDALVLPTFDALPLPGTWCRFFCPWGNTRVFLHNMYFSPPPSMKHYLLT